MSVEIDAESESQALNGHKRSSLGTAAARAYFSAAVLVPDAIGMLANAGLGR
jgi:hypothetical protein